MHRKINKYFYAAFMLSILMGGLFFSSCENDDKEDLTTIKLNVYGPSPALRGGELKFIGMNLDKVTSIVLADNVEVSTFVSKKANEIIITIPQETKPGKVTLKTPKGDIVSQTLLTFSEPMSIESFSPATVKPGDTYTINGDYLNNIAEVIFYDGVVVDSADFISQSRKKIELKVPKAAGSGKVAISNGAEMPVIVYTATDLTVTNPVTFSTLTPATVKAGAALTIAGTNLNLIKSIVIPDGNKIDSAAITLNSANTEMTVTIPATAKEGVIKAMTYSGIEMALSQDLKLVAPTVSNITPATVKNGASVTITGTDLDLVTSVSFTGGVNGTINVQSATSIEVSVPLTATDGVVTLNTNSGHTATTAALTMLKPTITALSTLLLTAGDKITITGTDLDLVRKIHFLGGSVTYTPTSDTSFEVEVPGTCSGIGPVTIETVNGTQIASAEQLTIKASTTPAIINITPSVAPGGLMVITGKNLNFVESIYFETNVKAVLYGPRTESSISVYIPKEAKHGKTSFTMNSFSGEVIVSPSFTYGTDPILATTVMLTNFDGGGNSQSTWGSPFGFGTPSIELDGTQCMIGNTNVSGWNWTWAANWGTLPALNNPNNYVFKIDICITKAAPGVSAGMCFRGWDNSINLGNIFENTTNGQWVTLTFDLNKDNAINGTGDFGMFIYAGSTTDLSGVHIDNMRFDLKSTTTSSSGFKLIGL